MTFGRLAWTAMFVVAAIGGFSATGATPADRKGAPQPLPTPIAVPTPSAMGSVGPRVPTGPQTIAPPAASVTVTPSSNLQTMIDGNQAGTTYWITAGTYTAQSVTTPKNGDVYIFQQGAVFDGGGSLQYAFLAPRGVSFSVKNCTVQNYNTPSQHGSIHTRDGGGASLIQNCLIQGSGAVGVEAGGNDRVIANKITNNQQEGYACGGSPTFTDNEISFNNPNNSSFYEKTVIEFGGGKCWSTTNMIFQYNWLHDNHGPGAWFDAGAGAPNQGAEISYNLFEKNWGHGAFYEVSGYGHIHHNVSRGNGTRKFPNWDPFNGQITVSSSSGRDASHLIEVDHNTVTSNYGGTGVDGMAPAKYGSITFVAQNRPDAPYNSAGGLGYPRGGTRYVYVHDNTMDENLDNPHGMVGMANDYGDTGMFNTTTGIFFDLNTYKNLTDKTPFWLGSAQDKGFSAWQAGGQDLHGRIQ